MAGASGCSATRGGRWDSTSGRILRLAMATLNYRGPTTASDLRAKLARMEQSFLARWLLLVLAGAAFCLIGPVLFGTLIWLHQFGERGGEIHSWLNRVVVTGVIFLPILFLLEWATRGKMFEEGAETLGDSVRLPGVRGAAQGLVIVEMCLWGPRMVIAG